MRVTGSLVVLLMLVMASPVQGAPWASPDDPRLRHSLHWLVDQGCVDMPVTTWPVMWADITDMLRDRDIAAHCRRSEAWRYLRFEHDRKAHPGPHLEARLEAASREPLFRDFADDAREKAAAGARLEWLGDGLAAGLSVTRVRDPRDGDETRLDGSWVAGTLGNWVVGAGQVDRWWGPGWHSSDIFSTNARPVPAVWLSRRRSTAFEVPLLRWLGPWQFTAMAGELESDRAIPDTRLLGARLAFRPASGLEIGMSRTALWAGDDDERPSSGRSLWECLIGDSNRYADEGPDACGQMAGFDLRWSFLNRPEISPAFYAQAIGEDEAGMLPSKYMALAGFELGTRLGRHEQRFFLEYTDNIAGTWPSEQRYNVSFDNGSYPTGYRYKGRNIASTWETDTRAGSLGGSWFTPAGKELGITFTHAALNRDGTLRNRPEEAGTLVLEPRPMQRRNIARLRYRQPFLRGRLTLSGWFMDREIESRYGQDNDNGEQTRTWPRAIVMASWEYRFAL